MKYPYKLYDAYISIDDIQLDKIAADVPPTHLQAVLEEAVSKGISDGLKKYGIDEHIATTALHVSVCYHDDDWRSCSFQLPPYDEDVLVCLSDGKTRVMTHRTKNDYSKDCYDFLHKLICLDAMYWMPLPKTPGDVIANHSLKE